MNMKFKEVVENNTKSNKLVIENKKLIEKNKRLVSDIVFLTKQVSDRDIIIQRLQELANLGIDGG